MPEAAETVRLDASGVNLRITEHPSRKDMVDCAVVLVVEDLAVRPSVGWAPQREHPSARRAARAQVEAARGS